jgi:hypothetical protein
MLFDGQRMRHRDPAGATKGRRRIKEKSDVTPYRRGLSRPHLPRIAADIIALARKVTLADARLTAIAQAADPQR